MPLNRGQLEIAHKKHTNGYAKKLAFIRQQELRKKLQKEKDEVIKKQQQANSAIKEKIKKAENAESSIPGNGNTKHEVSIFPRKSKKVSFVKTIMLLATIGLIATTVPEVLPTAEAANRPKDDRGKSKDSKPLHQEFDQEVAPQAARQTVTKANANTAPLHAVPPIRRQPENKDEETAASRNNLNAIKDQLINKITCSPKAKAEYDKNPKISFENDKTKIINILLNLAKNRELYCKIASLLEKSNANFEILICAKDEISSQALFERFTNKMTFPIAEISSSTAESYVSHEVHHAWVNYQNRKANRIYYKPGTIKPDIKMQDPSSTPCDPVNSAPGKIACAEIHAIQINGLKKVDDLLSVFSLPSPINIGQLDPDKQQLVIQYLATIEGYEPLITDVVVQRNQVMPFIQQGVMDQQFKFKGPNYHMVIDDLHGWKGYAYEIEYKDGQLIAKTRRYKKPEKIKGPLLDLNYMLLKFSAKDIGPADSIKETDAVIHQLFANYTKIYDFLFPGLREYHLRRSDTNYQQCVGFSVSRLS